MKTLTTSPSTKSLIDEFVSLDWKTNPQRVLKEIDGLLEKYGLEIVMVDEGNDSYVFKIDKR